MTDYLHRLTAGAYEAVISEVGGSLHRLRHRGRDLLCRDDSPVPEPPHSGSLLVPWPNRIAHGRYGFDGADLQLPINEVKAGNAIHGLVEWHRWDVADRRDSSLTVTTTVCPRPGYPFRLQVAVRYRLGTTEGLTVTVTTTNGERPAPYAASMHPYLLAGSGPVDDWTLSLDAATVWEFDPAHLDDPKHYDVAGTPADFREPRRIGKTVLDHTYTDVRRQPDGSAHARVTGPDGHGVEIAWADMCRWVQVFTLDLPDSRFRRRAVAIEPMTAPPNAFRSTTDLVVLQPAEEHTASWTIRGV